MPASPKERLLSQLPYQQLWSLAREAGFAEQTADRANLVHFVDKQYSKMELESFSLAREKKTLYLGIIVLVVGAVLNKGALYLFSMTRDYTSLTQQVGLTPEKTVYYAAEFASGLMRILGGALIAVSFLWIAFNLRRDIDVRYRLAFVVSAAVVLAFIVSAFYPFPLFY